MRDILPLCTPSELGLEATSEDWDEEWDVGSTSWSMASKFPDCSISNRVRSSRRFRGADCRRTSSTLEVWVSVPLKSRLKVIEVLRLCWCHQFPFTRVSTVRVPCAGATRVSTRAKQKGHKTPKERISCLQLWECASLLTQYQEIKGLTRILRF